MKQPKQPQPASQPDQQKSQDWQQDRPNPNQPKPKQQPGQEKFPRKPQH